jgi:hypothetical protein
MLLAETAMMPGWVLPSVVVGTLVQFSFNAFVAVAIHRSRQTAEKMRSVEDRLNTTAERLVESKFAGVKETLDAIRERLKDGESTFGKLSERDQNIELAVAGKLDGLKDWLRKELVTSAEMAGHERRENERFATIERKLDQLLGQGPVMRVKT